jgi:hypothetical protein
VLKQNCSWHSDQDDDPFTTAPTTVPAKKTDPTKKTDPPKKPDPADDPLSHLSRLKHCKMKMKDETGLSDWLALESQSRVLCHASMYDVVYDRTKTPDNVLAEKAGSAIHGQQPLAMGTTPVDALLAYCRAHSGDRNQDISDLTTDLINLRDLLNQHEDDDVDGLQAAADESYEQSFRKIEGGTKWFFKSQSDPNVQPQVASDDVINMLDQLNQTQAAIDSGAREAATTKWKLFAIW